MFRVIAVAFPTDPLHLFDLARLACGLDVFEMHIWVLAEVHNRAKEVEQTCIQHRTNDAWLLLDRRLIVVTVWSTRFVYADFVWYFNGIFVLLKYFMFHRGKSNGFGTTWGWVNDDRVHRPFKLPIRPLHLHEHCVSIKILLLVKSTLAFAVIWKAWRIVGGRRPCAAACQTFCPT